VKILVCGKGGSGKSVVTTLLAGELASRGFKVLVVDMDESNFGLHRQLGLELPKSLTEYLGGRRELSQKIFKASGEEEVLSQVFRGGWKVESLPAECLSHRGNITLLAVGKIRRFEEGCACPMGALARSLLERLELGEREVILVDSDAGIEHFGRGVEGACSLILVVVDPTYESLRLSTSILKMAGEAGKPAYLILNRVNSRIMDTLMKGLDKSRILGVVPEREEIFQACLEGSEIRLNLKEVSELVDRLLSLKP